MRLLLGQAQAQAQAAAPPVLERRPSSIIRKLQVRRASSSASRETQRLSGRDFLQKIAAPGRATPADSSVVAYWEC